MTYQDIVSMAEEAGLPSAYDHFAEGQSPDPPFLLFLLLFRLLQVRSENDFRLQKLLELFSLAVQPLSFYNCQFY